MKKYGNKILKVLGAELETYSVKLKFSDGTLATISLDEIFSKPKGLAREIMKGNLFGKCFIESGALAWPNGFEICPDSLRLMASEQHRQDRIAA